MRIVPIALSNYFLKRIPINDTLLNHSNIFDFCLRLKVNKGWEALYKYIKNDNPYLDYTDSQKIEIIKNNGWINYYSDTAWIHESWIKEKKPYDKMATSLDYAFKQVCRKFDDFNLKTIKLSKNTRYYISNHGGALSKRNVKDDRITGVNIGFITTPFNKFIKKEIPKYDINYKFYLQECNKIINSIENKQLTLF